MAYALIGREDIAATLASNSTNVHGISSNTLVCGGHIPSTAALDADILTQPVPQQAQQQQQHFLLPYEQRLLLPAGIAQSSGHRPAAAACSSNHGGCKPGPAAAAVANRRSGRQLDRGLRGSGLTANSAAGSVGINGAGLGAAGASRTGSGGSGPAGLTGNLGMPIDGMEGAVTGSDLLRFGRDARLSEVQRLLSTNMPVILTVGGLIKAARQSLTWGVSSWF